MSELDRYDWMIIVGVILLTAAAYLIAGLWLVLALDGCILVAGGVLGARQKARE